MDDRTQLWNDLAAQIAVDSIRATTAAGSGHPTSSMSSAHLLAVLFADHLRFDVKEPHYPGNDRFVLSKGHAAPGLYATLKAVGAYDDEMLLSLRKDGLAPRRGTRSPIPEFPWVDVATGSLGQGLAFGLGMALAMKTGRRAGSRVGAARATPSPPRARSGRRSRRPRSTRPATSPRSSI